MIIRLPTVYNERKIIRFLQLVFFVWRDVAFFVQRDVAEHVDMGKYQWSTLQIRTNTPIFWQKRGFIVLRPSELHTEFLFGKTCLVTLQQCYTCQDAGRLFVRTSQTFANQGTMSIVEFSHWVESFQDRYTWDLMVAAKVDVWIPCG